VNPLRRAAWHHRIALAALLACGGCSEDAPVAQDRLLVVDGIEVSMADVEPYVAFLDSFLPEGGRKAKVLRILDEYVLPLRFAQRAFPAQRQHALARARGLCEVATNAVELDDQSRLLQERTRRNVSRLQPRLPVAMFLFEPLRVGSVSPPIEVPTGYIVATAFDLFESPLMLDDYTDALQVGFMTHDAEAWGIWLAAEKQRVAPLVTYVHPDYREAMPPWLQLPRLP
jgi:hypothetical protein